MQISLITKEVIRPNDAVTSNAFIPELDAHTNSTFGTVKDETPKEARLSRISSLDADIKSTILGITIDSRISKMEEEFSSMLDMLNILVGKTNTGNTETHPNISQQEGGGVLQYFLLPGCSRTGSVIRNGSF